MEALTHPHEAAVLNNLALRFERNCIYTATGPILIALNPLKPLPIYGGDVIARYRGKFAGEEPPHCYGLAEAAYRGMKSSGVNQTVVICGESGAGKTETTKLILRVRAGHTLTGAAMPRAFERLPHPVPPHAVPVTRRNQACG